MTKEEAEAVVARETGGEYGDLAILGSEAIGYWVQGSKVVNGQGIGRTWRSLVEEDWGPLPPPSPKRPPYDECLRNPIYPWDDLAPTHPDDVAAYERGLLPPGWDEAIAAIVATPSWPRLKRRVEELWSQQWKPEDREAWSVKDPIAHLNYMPWCDDRGIKQRLNTLQAKVAAEAGLPRRGEWAVLVDWDAWAAQLAAEVSL